jgi:ElaB/YqjD/DUF883 family membrane-anchored ribosome-binding protein
LQFDKLSLIYELNNIFNKIADFLENYGNFSLGDIYEKEKEKIENLLKELDEKIKEISHDGIQQIKSGLQKIRNEMIEMGANDIVTSFKIYIQELRELLISLKDVSLEINRELEDPLYKIFDDIKNMNVKGKLNELIEKIPSLSEMQSIINDTINSFKEFDCQELLPYLVNKSSNFIASVETFLQNRGICDLIDQLSNLTNIARDYLDSLQSLKKVIPFNISIFVDIDELNSTLYGIFPTIDKLITQFKSINTIFPSTIELNSILSDFKSKFEELNSNINISEYTGKLKIITDDLYAKINKFLDNNEKIEKIKEKAELIEAFLSDLNTTQLNKEFNDYIDSLKKLYISINDFNNALLEKLIGKKLMESIYPNIELVKKMDGQGILSKLSKLPNMPQNLLDAIKQLQSGEFQMDKITDIFDKITKN